MKKEFECSIVSKDTRNRRFDLMVGWDGKRYAISVGTKEYINTLKLDNQTLTPEFRDNEKIFLVPPLDDVTEVCKLLFQTPSEVLEPYLEPIASEPGS